MEAKSNNQSHTIRPNKDHEPYLVVALKLIPCFEVILAAIGLYYLGFAEGGISAWAKLIVFCLAAYLVAYAIYRMAIEKGVPLVAAGSSLAGPLSGLSIFLVGASFFAVTAPGLTITQVEELRLTRFLEELGAYVDGRIGAADQSAELVPIMRSLAEDLETRREQEARTGFGPIAQSLDSLHGRAAGLAAQMNGSLGVRQEVLGQIQAQLLAMETSLSDEDSNIWERRSVLRRQYSSLVGQLSNLDAAVPVSVVRSYASELESGILIPNRSDANARINHTLSGYSEALNAALSEQTRTSVEQPDFPSRTGALDTFQYIGKFAPVFMFAGLVDLTFPLALWAYVLMTVIVHSPQAWRQPRKRTDFDDLTDLRAIDMRELRERQQTEKSTSVRRLGQRKDSRPNGKIDS